MPDENDLIISESDYEMLIQFIRVSRSTATEELDKELLKADIYPDYKMPINVVRLYTKTRVQDLNTGVWRVVSVVMPWESNVLRMKISVLSPVGMALIGAKLGAVIDWPVPNRKPTVFKISEIINSEIEPLTA